jgi:hypothetical protein
MAFELLELPGKEKHFKFTSGQNQTAESAHSVSLGARHPIDLFENFISGISRSVKVLMICTHFILT